MKHRHGERAEQRIHKIKTCGFRKKTTQSNKVVFFFPIIQLFWFLDVSVYIRDETSLVVLIFQPRTDGTICIINYIIFSLKGRKQSRFKSQQRILFILLCKYHHLKPTYFGKCTSCTIHNSSKYISIPGSRIGDGSSSSINGVLSLFVCRFLRLFLNYSDGWIRERERLTSSVVVI